MTDVFISCSSENVSAAFETFIKDLTEQVRQRSVLTSYYYRHPSGLGTDWQASSGAALRRAKVFVPIYSPHFFRSEICEQEYAAFLSRVERAGGEIDCIVPLLWIQPTEPLPAAVQRIVHSQNIVMPEDRDRDIEGIFAARHQVDSPYPTLLRELATVIAAKAKTGERLGSDVEVDWQNAPAIFGLRSSERPAAAVAERVKVIHLAPMAGSKAEMEAVPGRVERTYYGASSEDWNPYADEAGFELVDAAFDIARELKLRPKIVDGQSDLVRFIRSHEANARNSELVMIFVDPWAMGVPRLAEQLDSYDRQRFSNSAVLIPTYGQDEETLQRLPELLAQVLPRTASDSSPQLFHTELRDVQEFRIAFKRAVHHMRVRTVAMARRTFSAQASTPARLPLVTGPVT